MKKESEDDSPIAYVSLEGNIIECNNSFSSICGKKTSDLVNSSLTSLAKYDTPTSMLESAYMLDHLAADEKNKVWKCELAPSKMSKDDEEYEIIAHLSDKMMHGQKVIEATIRPSNHSHSHSQPKSAQRQSFLQSKEELLERSPSGSKHVLVVDDSVTSLKVMAKMIQRLGHTVETAINGFDALQHLKSDIFDIVLMDINMPQMNGLEASHEFRKLERENRAMGRPYQKIIAMSGDISNTIFHEVTNAGFDAFIPKPLTEEKFLEVLSMPTK